MKAFKTLKLLSALTIGFVLYSSAVLAADRAKAPTATFSKILIYKGEKAGSGPALPGFQLKPGDEIVVTAKFADDSEKEVQVSNVTLTWKADPELSVKPISGKPFSATVKALKASTQPLFFSAVYDDGKGKKIKGEVMGLVK